jgi:DNA-directed RNA polymerase subunit RPC12/RpoP
MAACTDFSCNVCGFKIESWDDGHPYLVDGSGERHYFYHPGGDRAAREFYLQETSGFEVNEKDYLAFWNERGGCESSLICLHCGRRTRRDPDRDPMKCTGCRSRELLDTQKLEARTCPKCKKGTFHGEWGAIS